MIGKAWRIIAVLLLTGVLALPAGFANASDSDMLVLKQCFADGACRDAVAALPAVKRCSVDTDCTMAKWRSCGCPMEHAVNKDYLRSFPAGETQTACRASCSPDTPFSITDARCEHGACVPAPRR